MNHSIIGSSDVGAALAREFARGGIAVGIVNTRGPDSIEAVAKQLGAKVAAMTLQDASSASVILLAVPLRANTAVDDATNAGDISPDELMGILNTAR
jgi:8-hydroxy-5-deazaflavin:NADPH oxidoreductase